MKKLLHIISIAVFIFIGVINVYAQSRYEVVSNSMLNIRNQPSSAGGVVGALSPKTHINVIHLVDGWAEFLFNGKTAYVSLKYLKKVNADVAAELYKVISTSNLNVRHQPSIQSGVLGSLKPGMQVEVLSTLDGWAEIKFNSGLGYISSKYIRKIEQSPVVQEEKENYKVVSQPVQQEIVPVPEETTAPQVVDGLNFKEKLGIDIVPNVYYGYVNFSSDNASPKGSMGGGIDLAVQFIAKEKISFIPKNYYTEVSLGYSMRGSAAFPMHYVNIKLQPFGYRYDLFGIVMLYGKLGAYLGYPFSKIETDNNSFDSNLDVGLTVSLGVEYRNIGLGVSYERGFTDVCTSKLSLKNSCVFLNLSYRFFSLK